MKKENIQAFKKLCELNEFNQEEFRSLVSIEGFLDADVIDGDTALQYAIKHSAFTVAKQLIKAGANPHSNYSGRSWGSPIELVIVYNQRELLELMFEHGADPKVRTGNNDTLLHTAVLSETTDPEIVGILLKNGVDPEAKSNDISAVDYAETLGEVNTDLKSYSEKAQIMKSFLEARNKARETFKALCTANVFDENVLNRLLSDPDFLEYDMGKGYTPLQYAIACAYTEDEDLSLADPRTAIAVSEALIKAGANFTSDNTILGEYSPIALTIKANQVDLLRQMLNKGVDKSFKSQNGNTLLHTAVNRAEDISILEALLEHGADPMLENNLGETAIDIASGEEAELLRQYVKKEETLVNLDTLKPIAQVFKAMVDEQYVTTMELKINFNQKNFNEQLYDEMNWTAFKLHKIKAEDLYSVPTVLRDIHEDKKLEYSCDLNSLSPEVQKSLFNIIAYAGKIKEESPSRINSWNDIREAKYNATIDFLKSVLSGSPDQLQEKVEEFMKKPEITANRGTGLFRLHGIFAKKGKEVGSTMQELFYDLNKVLEAENPKQGSVELK